MFHDATQFDRGNRKHRLPIGPLGAIVTARPHAKAAANRKALPMTRNNIRRVRPSRPMFASDSVEARSVEAALLASDLAWEAQFAPLFIEKADALGGIQAVESHRALVRADSRAVLGVHGGQYEPLNNGEAFAGLQPLLDAGEARIVRAGHVQGGRKVYIEAEIGESRVPVKVGDECRTLAVFKNSHDGTTPATVDFVIERLVCLNGMRAHQRSAMFRRRHTRGLRAELAEWIAVFAEQRAQTASTVAVFQNMARRRMNDRALTAYVRETLSEGAGADDTIVVRGVDRIVQLAHEAPGADPGSLWGAYNAITYWATHERGRSDDARLAANMFGTGGALLERAHSVAVALADNLPMMELGRASYDNSATAAAEFGSLLGRPARISESASLFDAE